MNPLSRRERLGVATSEAYRQMAVKGFPDPRTFVDWVMSSRGCTAQCPLPALVRIEPVEDKGTFVILTPENGLGRAGAKVRARVRAERRGTEGPHVPPVGVRGRRPPCCTYVAGACGMGWDRMGRHGTRRDNDSESFRAVAR
nr:Imm52 family immunity protein [Stigmatella aurantiaca]